MRDWIWIGRRERVSLLILIELFRDIVVVGTLVGVFVVVVVLLLVYILLIRYNYNPDI